MFEMDIQVLFNFVVAGLIGAFIGLERTLPRKSFKTKQLDTFGWLRSYALIAMIGALTVWLDIALWLKVFTALWLLIISTFVIVAYHYQLNKTGALGVTTEYSVIITYILWVLVMLWNMKFVLIFAIIVVIVLSAKDFLEKFQSHITREELGHTLKFLVVALVVLPLLPDEKYSFASLLSNLWLPEASSWDMLIWQMKFFNPHGLWFFVVTMSAIGYIGYILSKVFGKESGILLSSLVWWLVSSTAVTATMSEQSSKDAKNYHMYVVGALLANCIMLLRVIFIVLVFWTSLIGTLIFPALLMFLGLALCTYYFYNKSRTLITKTKVWMDDKMESPFRLAPALKFWGYVLLIKFIAGIGLLYKDVWNENIFYYLLGIMSGLADVDAITQTMSSNAKDGLVIGSLAVTTILIAVMSNNMVKGSIALKFGEKNFWKNVMMSFLVSMLWGIMGIIAINFIS